MLADAVDFTTCEFVPVLHYVFAYTIIDIHVQQYVRTLALNVDCKIYTVAPQTPNKSRRKDNHFCLHNRRHVCY